MHGGPGFIAVRDVLPSEIRVDAAAASSSNFRVPAESCNCWWPTTHSLEEGPRPYSAERTAKDGRGQPCEGEQQ
jgi:hypothetical protein